MPTVADIKTNSNKCYKKKIKKNLTYLQLPSILSDGVTRNGEGMKRREADHY